VVVRSAPFHRITEPGTKLVPVTVRVKAPLPATFVAGESDVSVGWGFVVVKVCGVEVPPPNAGLKTVTLTVLAEATSASVMAAVSVVAEIYVVVRSAPFQRTTEPGMKLVPVAVRVKAPLPATFVAGESEVSVGWGFVVVKVWGSEVPPPGAGVYTVTLAVPAVAISAAGMAAVSWEAET